MTLTEARALTHTYVTPNGPDDAVVLDALNWISERIINSGIWKGLKAEIQFEAPSGFITLPRRCESALAVRFDRAPVLIYNHWHSFVVGGLGEISEEGYSVNALVDQGSGFATYADIGADELAYLRVKIEDANDATLVCNIKGLDSDGRIIFDSVGVEGVSVTMAVSPVTTTQIFSAVQGFYKPVSQGYVSLWKVVNGVETQIGLYEPGETTADLHRYHIGNRSELDTITVLAKRKYIPAKSPTDQVYPSNGPALKFGAMAFNFFVQNDLERSEIYWNRALQEINLESRATRGGNQTRINTTAHGFSIGRIRSMR